MLHYLNFLLTFKSTLLYLWLETSPEHLSLCVRRLQFETIGCGNPEFSFLV
jgi:hypothetical protein